MRILFVLHSHSYGGAETQLLQSASALAERGLTPALAAPANSWLMDRFRGLGLTGFHLPMHGFHDAWSMVRLGWFARNWRADLLHGHLTRGAHYAGIGGTLAGIPAVATAHSTNAGKHFQRAQRIIAVSEAVRKFLLGGGYQAARLTLVRNGVADPNIEPAHPTLRQSLGLGAEVLLLGMVARFVRDKGQDLALNALARSGHCFHLALIGDPATPWGQGIQARCEALDLSDRVHFLGFREGAVQLMREFDALLAPSRREALSLTLVEAAAVGIPVVASRVGGNPEVVVDNETGLLVPTEDAPALSLALDRLAANAALRQRLGRQARERYLREFSLTRMVDATEAVYREILAEASR